MANQLENKYYAHTKEGRPPEEWQTLNEHLKHVAEMVHDATELYERFIDKQTRAHDQMIQAARVKQNILAITHENEG